MDLAMLYFPSLADVAPLHALTRLQRLCLVIASSASISLEPLRQLTSLTALILRGIKAHARMTDYDLQPLSALSRTLQALSLRECVLHSLPSIGSLGTTLRQLTLMDCTCQPGFQLASLIPQLPGVISLHGSDVTAADLDATGQHPKHLISLSLKRASDITSLAALAPVTNLTSIALESCSHLSSIHPLAALTGLHSLHLHSCSQLASLSPLTALRRLRQLRLEACPQLAASLPASLQQPVIGAGQDV
jgi:hypothetical protein